MRRTVPAVAVVLLALTACGGDDPTPSASPSARTPAPVTTTASGSPSSSPSATGTPWPSGCPSPQPLQAGWTVITADVRGGAVTPPRTTHDVKLKSIVRIVVTADVTDEVHLHSYDRRADVTPSCPGVIDFEAGIPGSVEVELEDAGVHLFQVRAR